jgi:hypothetical protein
MIRRPVPPTAVFAALAGLMMLAGCASKEERLRQGLLDLGLSARAAQCLAPPLARDLTADELRQIAALVRSARAEAWRTRSTDELLRRLAVLEDGHVLAVATRAALGCAVPLAF